MLRATEATARRLGMRIIRRKLTPAQRLNVLNRQLGTRINAAIRRTLRRYPDADGKVRITKCVPVPRPDYEAEWGGPYSHIIHALYCKRWGCVFGLTVTGKIKLWSD